MQNSHSRIPVTLLTGFLGAGKTTLLNQLIRDPSAGRIAVIMNELGDVGLDHDLIEESTEETVLMQSGCICCTYRGDISKTLGRLMVRKNRGLLSFDRVVIETTGIADPGPIIHTLVIDRVISPDFYLDGVITLADAATGPSTLDHHEEAVQQVAMADLIVVSKPDLVNTKSLTSFETRLQNINKTAKRIRAKHGALDISALFGLSAMRNDVSTSDVADWLGTSPPAPDPLAGLSGFGAAQTPKVDFFDAAAAPHSHHDDRIASASIEIDEPIPGGLFDFWLEKLISAKGPNILRLKGIVYIKDMEWPFVFHGVQHIFDAPVPLETLSGEETRSRIVIIARDISEEDLAESLKMLKLKPKSQQTEDGMTVETTDISL